MKEIEIPKYYEIKSIHGAGIVKDVDTAKGIVVGYFSSFSTVDSDGDMMMPGSFVKTISEKGPDVDNSRIKHIFMHDTMKPIAKIEKLKEDDFGLKFHSKSSKAGMGPDVLTWYDEGIINEHSIGFNTLQSDHGDDHTKITEVNLWEGSSVLWGANQHTPLSGLKSRFKTEKDILDRMDLIVKCNHNGRYTDEGHILLEIELKQLQQAVASLIAEKPEDSASTSKKDKPKGTIVKPIDQFNYFEESLKKQLKI